MKRGTINKSTTTPAKAITIAEYCAIKRNNDKTTVDRHARKLIGDLCDFCLKNIKVRRVFMPLRLRGYKFTCRECNPDITGKKLVMEFKPPIK